MLRFSAVIVAVVLCFSFAVAQEEAGAGDEVKVDLIAADQPVQEVAAEITGQTGLQVAVTANTVNSLTGKLEDKTVDEAVRLLAEASRASWMRAYFLELTPPEEPYTAEELLAIISDTREDFIESLTDEQRGELFPQFQRGGPGEEGRRGPPEREAGAGGGGAEAAAAQRPERPEGDAPGERGGPGGFGGFGQMLAGPGGGVAPMPPREDGQEGARGGGGMMGNQDDPVRRLLLPGRTDTITIELADASLYDALDNFTLTSRFIVVADPNIDAAVTVNVSLEDAPLSDALDAIAAATGATWRAVYVLGQPRDLTQAEIAQRDERREAARDQRFNTRWAEFWQSSPQDRSASIERQIAGVERMAERIENAPPERRERMERRQARSFQRMVGYSTQIGPEQRLELKALLQAMARARGQ